MKFEALVERAAERYCSSGRFARHFARGKLRGDPFFRWALVQIPLLKPRRILDLGCGQGLLFACLAADNRAAGDARFHGIEVDSARVEIARRALGPLALIDCADIRSAEIPHAPVIVIVDVLLYMSAAEQDLVLEKAVAALEAGGTLLLREGDAHAGLRFRVTAWCERLLCTARGRPGQPLHYRAATEWRAALERLGLAVTTEAMSEGTPFANVLYVGKKV